MSQENTNKSGETEGGDGSGGGDVGASPTITNPFAALTSTTASGLIGDRDQTLAYFQELTHLDDIDQCQAILESTNWDLDQAVQSFYNGDIGMPQIHDEEVTERAVEGLNIVGSSARFTSADLGNGSVGSTVHDNHQINASLSQSIFSRLKMPPNQDLYDPFSVGPPVAEHASIINQMREEMFPSISPSKNKRLLNFNIEYLDKKFTLHVLDSECVRKIKELIKEKISIPCEHQKLNGWRNKDLYITDNMVLNQLSLPLETNLFVINTADSKVESSKEKSIGGVVFPSGSNDPSKSDDLDDFVLHIKLINTKKQQITIINNSSTFDSTELTQNMSSSHSNRTSSETYFHLNFQASTKFIDIRRKLTLLTSIYANNQEWFYHLAKSSEENFEETLTTLKTYNDLASFHNLLETSKLFALPLTSLFEDNKTLSEIKKTLDELTGESSSNSIIASSSSTSSSLSNQATNKYQNSKLTPPSNQAKANTNVKTTAALASPPVQMIFIVTSKNPNNFNEIANTSSTTTYREFDHLMNLEQDADSISMNSIHGSSLVAINSKKAKINEIGTDSDGNKHDSSNNNESSKNSNFYDESLDNDDEMQNAADDDDDLDEHFLLESKEKQKPLIPKDCTVGDELAGTCTFLEEFNKRYGPMVPLFFIGTLEDAIKEALLCPAKDRKLLSIYLHSDHTVFCNIFCSKTMCDENVINFTSNNFVVWPWDITVKEHENHFYETCSKHLGSVFVSNLRNLKEKFPLFLIVTRVRSTNEVVAIIEGDCTNEAMMHRLMQTYEMFEMQRIKDERDEVTRDEREKIKRDQDAAYQTSLEADKAKRQRQDEENERLKQQEKLAIEMEKQRLLERENKMKECTARLPTEPTLQATEPTSHIRFRLPSGEIIQRRFFIKDKLEAVLDFATSHGYFVEDYKILTSWPRKDLTNESVILTIEQLKMFPQETLTLEQR